MGDSPNPDHYALVIGIKRYPQFRPLDGAGTDAVRFAAWLERDDGGGLPAANIQLRISPPEPSLVDIYQGIPNAGTVKEALDAIQIGDGLRHKIRLGKRIYFYFSGHGVGNVSDDVGMLLPVTDPVRLRPNISLRLYREFFQLGSFFDEAIYILDCCRDFKPKFTGDPPEYDEPTPPAEFKRTKEFVVMAAAWGAQAFQIKDGSTEDRRGVLTDALLAGLDGAQGAVDERGFVTTTSLANYLKAEVPLRATIAQLAQKPEVGQPLDDMILAVIPESKQKRTLVQIVMPPNSVGTLRLLRSDWSEIDRHPIAGVAANGVAWEVSLLRGANYVVEHVESGSPRRIDLTTTTEERKVFLFMKQ